MRIVLTFLLISLLAGCSKDNDVTEEHIIRMVFDSSNYKAIVLIRKSYAGGSFSDSSPEFTGSWEKKLDYTKGDNLFLTFQVYDLAPKNTAIKLFVDDLERKLTVKSEIIQGKTYYTTQTIL